MASLGQTLKEEREARNISIEEIAAATKIVPRYLEALEADRLDIMPGGFFIRGIIRTYARFLGLDGDDVLARYKTAGLVAEPERKRHSFLKPAPESAPRLAPIPPSEPALSPVPKAAPELVFEPVPDPKPKLSPAARKRIFAWAWRGAAAVLVIAVLVVLWSSRRPRQPQAQNETAEPATIVTQTVLPPPQRTEPASPPLSAPAPEPQPAVGEVWKGVTIEISFQAETWIQVYTDGVLKVDGLFPAGATAQAQADEQLLIHVGNAGGFTFLLNGKPAKPLGRAGHVLTDIKITPNNYKDFLEGQSPGPPAG